MLFRFACFAAMSDTVSWVKNRTRRGATRPGPPGGREMQQKRNPIAIGVVAFLLTACGGRPGQQGPAAQKPVGATVSVAVAPAEKANVTQTFTYTGDVKATSEISVMPKQSGRIVTMPVEVGSQVSAGDLIAALDHTTLDLTLQQAQAGLLAAQAKLATVQAGPRDENVRQAELNVDTAQSRLQNMINGPKAASVAQGEAAVDATRQRLDALRHPRPETVAQAQLNIDQAQQKLDAIQHPRLETVTQAQLNVDQAKQKLATVQAGGKPDTVGQAQANLVAAQARLQALKN